MLQQSVMGKFFCGVDQQIVIRGVVFLCTHNEMSIGNTHYQTDGVIRLMGEVDQDVEILGGKLLGQRFLEAAVPVQVFIAEKIGGELGETVERDLLVIDVTHQPHGAVCILKAGKNSIDFLISVLSRDIANQPHRFRLLQRDDIYIPNWLIVSNILLDKMSLYKIHHSKMRETKLKAQK